ncbi:MAG: hypothetical protein ACFFE8_00965 [Candidatus Heimdallarchaeota archaeon]
MERSVEYEARIVCDADCRVCVAKREKDVSTEGGDILHFCRSCQEKYLCPVILPATARGREYQCPKCSEKLTEMTLERAQQMGLAFGVQLTRIKPERRPVEEIKRTWFYSPSDQGVLSENYVKDLLNYKSLGVSQLTDLMYHADFSYRPEAYLEKRRMLWDIFAKKPQIIRSLHNSLITRSEHRRVDLVIRTLMQHETLGCTYISSIIPKHLAGTIDLIGIDQKTGGLVWIVVHEDRIDEQLINTLFNEILSVPPLEFMGIERLILLTRKWIWMAAEIARRQGKISTRWKQLTMELWEETQNFKLQKLA